MDKRHTLLIVDDTEMNRSLLADMLVTDYEILEASNGVEAVAVLNKHHDEIALVLLDIVMPQMDGFEVLTVMNKNGWINDTPVITISAETSSSYIDHAYDLGATDYISRPFDEKTVQRRVRNTIMLYSKQKMLEGMVAEQIVEKEKNNFLMVEILSNIVEFRNGESGLHVLHIRLITEILLRQLMKTTEQYPLSSSQLSLIVNASALHDIGKISIPESILNKPGKLTAQEFEIMKTHSAIGAQILENAPYRQNVELVRVARDICRWHHERYDGRGYPDSLKGEEIPISAQVVALADVYDALTNVRVYKPAFSHDTAMQMILNGECGAFNPVLLDCLQRVGNHLEEELKIRSLSGIADVESWQLTSRMIANGQASSRTLALLEQERIKYQFFASMSNEIQFEIDRRTDILTMSQWGASQLGLSELIVHPEEDADLLKVFRKEDYLDLQERLNQATPENPIAGGVYCLQVKGQSRWYKAVARPLWLGEEPLEIIGFIGKFIDIHEEHMRLAQLRKMAEQDSLTKLYNHMSARKAAQEALSVGEDKRFALILFDLDFFKDANDQYGHMFGDQVLQHVAQTVLSNTRSGDIAARIGGDEFSIFAEYKEEIEPFVQRIFRSLQGKFQDFQISVSMGVSLFPQNGTDYEELFHTADQALYSAKKNGRDQYHFYNESMHELLSVLSPMDN